VIVPQCVQDNDASAATDTVGRFLRAFHGGTQPLSTFAAGLTLSALILSKLVVPNMNASNQG